MDYRPLQTSSPLLGKAVKSAAGGVLNCSDTAFPPEVEATHAKGGNTLLINLGKIRTIPTTVFATSHSLPV
ncbi:MAG: hypothetical protein EOO38_27130 [Cytophagaceae bacterium]|nr:MAG: hypothetical protein EOO38_27130 [Cytophagaceae bacterium]